MNENKAQESKKVKTMKAIARTYFVGALTGSFIHIVTASEKMGGEGVEAYATPFMIDGLAVMGMIMRHEDFSKKTNKIGFRIQLLCGSMSLAMNVYAGLGHSIFGILFGIAIVSCFVLAEWLVDNIEGREVDEQAEKDQKAKAQAAADALAAAELVRQAEQAARDAAAAIAWKANCNHPTECASETQCASKAKAQKTRKATARKAQREAKVLEGMLA